MINFVVVHIIFVTCQATIYSDLVDWKVEACTEPPLTMDMKDSEVMAALDGPLHLPNYPSHTQDVERLIPVVTESCIQRVGYTARHRLVA